MTHSPVVESPPTTTELSQVGTRNDAAALAFRRHVRLIDRLARMLISISGVTIICAVLGIGLFLILETLPLFHGARLVLKGVQHLPAGDSQAKLVIVDEHQQKTGVLGTDALLRVVSLSEEAEPPEQIPLPGLEGRQVSAVSRVLRNPHVALGTDQGEVWIGTIDLVTVFEGSQRSTRALVERDTMLQAVPGHRISQLAYKEMGERSVVASVVDDTHLIVTRITTQRPLIGPLRRAQESIPLSLGGLGSPSSVLLNETATELLVGTNRGLITRWRLPSQGAAEFIETIQAIPEGSVSAMAYLLGDRSIVVGGSDGSVATWSLVRNEIPSTETVFQSGASRPIEQEGEFGNATGGGMDEWQLTRIHTFSSHASAIAAIAASPRDKGFITASMDGIAKLHYMTSGRTLAQFSIDSFPSAIDFAPKANATVLLGQEGRLHHWEIHNPHPEISLRALFGKIWYEGYRQPEYVWQSSGGTDDFEPKFSMVPLIFGTLKGTFYALLFAVPLALFGALYCSQFLDKRLRHPIKSTIELMAALPSVVLGFVAGVVLAPLVQRQIVSVLIMPVVLLLVSMSGLILGRLIPVPSVKSWIDRHEFWVLSAGFGVGVCVAALLGPVIERGVLGGSFETWLLETTGTRYDQRNALIVGWAIGFAVIPIIFTICEDAFSAVPKHLVGASLACGASAWQTAWRVVLPAAGSGVFSAVMVGFGRAVGETMIVLMATGNTPIMDWTLFNGFRALSANIAVEIPEAPYGGTLYRILFVAALLLFAMTFVVNTVAEWVRLHLRRQLQGL